MDFKEGQEVRLKIKSVLYEVEASLFSEEENEEDGDITSLLRIIEDNSPDEVVINTVGKVSLADGRFSVSYDESEATGMSGATTSVSFFCEQPEIISMIRTGSVSTALVFEERKRHHCLYKTPYMPFEICVHTLSTDNKLTEDGTLSLDYVIEIRGAQAERTKFSMQILP